MVLPGVKLGETGFGLEGGVRGGDVEANPPLSLFGDELPGDVIGGVTAGAMGMLPEANVSGFVWGGGVAAGNEPLLALFVSPDEDWTTPADSPLLRPKYQPSPTIAIPTTAIIAPMKMRFSFCALRSSAET